jgi:hypothetical protein
MKVISMQYGQKWRKMDKTPFLKIKINLRLRFDIKKCPDYQKKIMPIIPDFLLRILSDDTIYQN